MSNHLTVKWWDGTAVGLLAHRGTLFFEYDQAWIARGHNLSPISLPFLPSIYSASKDPEGLPGFVADCLPDKWGRRVAEKDFAAHGFGEMTAMKLLAWRGNRGLGALRIEPTLSSDGSHVSPKLGQISIVSLTRGAIEIDRGLPCKVLPQLARGGTAGGAYPKAVILAYDDGSISVDQPDGVGEPCILKFDLSPRSDQAPVEYVYLELARKAGVRPVKARLVDEGGRSRRRHLLVSRFDVDRTDPRRRVHFHSLAGMLHKESNALDYRDLFKVAIRLGVDPNELREIARRMVFNVLASNHDDHGKNHAFLYDERTKAWMLTPAFDLTYTESVLDRGMFVSGEVWPHKDVMEALCRDAGIKKEEYNEIFETVRGALASWRSIARKAKIDNDLIRSISDRHDRILHSVFPTVTIAMGSSASRTAKGPGSTRRGY